MKKIKNLKNARRYIYPMRTYLLSTRNENNKSNLITLDWVMPVSIDPPLLGASIGVNRFSEQILKSSDDFVISVPTKNMLKEVWFAGTKSGRNLDKFQEAKLTKIESNIVNSYSLEEAVANIECKIREKKRFGDHFLYVGEIVGGTYNDDFFDNGRPSTDLESGLLMHLDSNEFLEEKIEDFIEI